MANTPVEEKYNLDRKAASKLLKVSTRTIDRYIKSKKLSSNVIGGRVWLDKKEIEKIKHKRGRQGKVDKIDMSTLKMSIENNIDKVDMIELIGQDDVHTLSKTKRSRKSEIQIYKNLFFELKEELNKELKEKQERLEIANYRVGQLETQMRNSIPLLEYYQENYQKKKREKELEERILEQNALIKKIKIRHKYEVISKRIFLLILFILLALQPLWLLFIYK